MEDDQPNSSLVCIRPSELFPKKSLKSDDPSLQVLFPELEGESVEHLGSTVDATLALSNFRLFIRLKDSFLNIPIRLIESVELRDLFILLVNCKDARAFRISFDNNEQCVKWLHRLSSAIISPEQIEELFAFSFYAWTLDSKPSGYCAPGSGNRNGLCLTDRASHYSFLDEVHRMGFETAQEDSLWRITDVNSNFEICSTYPKLHIVPKSLTDSDLEEVASFRCLKRFPSVVWRHANGAVIARCSQPEVGWFGWRSKEDEKLLQAIGLACTRGDNQALADHQELNNGTDNADEPNGHTTCKEHRVLIVDARSYTAAVANRAKGGGCECTEYYPNCEVEFMNLANIHSIRKSYHSLRNLCSGPQDVPNWYSQLEKTNWLHHISMLLKAAMTVVNTVELDGKPVVVHCSDGWDRTTQIVALAELLLDPYYRTIEGFKVLVEREWLEFGHRFADRSGHGFDFDENQRCPVFIQWLDCVHQLQKSFPCAFEFNETFLCKLVQHTYSCLFGTFLCNSESERQQHNVKTRTCSVWSFFQPRRQEFRNFLYAPNGIRVLFPSHHVRNLVLWSAVYLAYPTPFSAQKESELNSVDSSSHSSSSTSPLRFSSNYSDSNIDTKPFPKTPVNSSKSDGDLLLSNICKKCDARPIDQLSENPAKTCHESSHSKDRPSTVCNGDVVHPNNDSSDSLYLSTSPEKGDTTSPSPSENQEIESGITSSSATVIQEDPQGENANIAGGESVSDTVSFGRTLKEFSTNSRFRKDSSSYEHLASSLNELSVTESRGQSRIENSEKKIEEESGVNGVPDVATNNCSECSKTEISTETSESGKSSSTQGSQASESVTTIKPSCLSSMYCRYLDNDGLTATPNELQDRLRQIEMLYQEQMAALHAQVVEERRRRLVGMVDVGVAGRGADLNEDMCSLPDSIQSGEHPLLSNGSGDESSWIQVEESDVEPTRWVPDHAATNCANCAAEFWIANRKHHCRNCGLVFCSTCSNHNLPVPNEQLYDPVRVCLSCFEKLVYMEDRQKGVRRRNLEMVSAVG